MCACVHVCMCACVHVCMCACVHVRMSVADRVHNAAKKTYNNVTIIIYKCTFAAFKTSRVTYCRSSLLVQDVVT